MCMQPSVFRLSHCPGQARLSSVASAEPWAEPSGIGHVTLWCKALDTRIRPSYRISQWPVLASIVFGAFTGQFASGPCQRPAIPAPIQPTISALSVTPWSGPLPSPPSPAGDKSFSASPRSPQHGWLRGNQPPLPGSKSGSAKPQSRPSSPFCPCAGRPTVAASHFFLAPEARSLLACFHPSSPAHFLLSCSSAWASVPPSRPPGSFFTAPASSPEVPTPSPSSPSWESVLWRPAQSPWLRPPPGRTGCWLLALAAFTLSLDSSSPGGTVARALSQRRKQPKAAAPVRPHTPARAIALPELDRLIHERMRLGIVSALATNESLSFNDLKRILKTTDGNLSVHARKLEEAEYISCLKYFEGRVPRTDYRLTAAGRRALAQYLDQMEEWIRVTREE